MDKEISETVSACDVAVDAAFVKAHLPYRAPDMHKGKAGRAALAVGSRRYVGAAILSAKAALRLGAGYVTLYAEKEVLRAAATVVPSCLFQKAYDAFPEKRLREAEKGADALVVGCGCGNTSRFASALYGLLSRAGCPCVLDADALNALSADRERTAAAFRSSPREILLTPHLAEFSRLTGKSMEEIGKDRLRILREYAKLTGASVLLKGHPTVIASRDGILYGNTTGGNALAKAGSGDVLAGAVVSLLASGTPVTEAAACAAFLHGMAGDRLAAKYSDYGVVPTDLPAAMAESIALL